MDKFVQNRHNTRIACINQVRTCYIIFRKVCIGELSEERNDAGEFDWVIRIYWDKWEETGKYPIPGINTDLRLKEYIRTFVPVIVSQRTPPPDRSDAFEYMYKKGMTYFDVFEFLCDNHGETNDMLLFGRTPTDYIEGYWDRLEDIISGRIPPPPVRYSRTIEEMPKLE